MACFFCSVPLPACLYLMLCPQFSEGGIFISPREAMRIPLPRKLDNTTVPRASVDRFVQRWNNTQTYWLQGYTTKASVPSHLDQNFIPHGWY
jgi:hypothetical protein